MTVRVVSSYKEAFERLKSIIRSFEQIYSVKLSYIETSISFPKLYATEKFLELEKLAIVLKKTLIENYDLPIVAITTGSEYFVIDGHHRCYAKYISGHSSVKAFRIFFKNYYPRFKYTWNSMEIITTNEHLPREYDYWKTIVKYVEYYRRIYGKSVLVKYGRVYTDELVPTQPFIEKSKVRTLMKEREFTNPIVVLEFGGKYYIVDGHARAYIAHIRGKESIEAVVLKTKHIPELAPGTVKTAKLLALKSIRNIKIL